MGTKKLEPLTPEQRALASAPESLAVARRVAKAYAKGATAELRAARFEERYSAALYGLVTAARLYRPEFGAWESYAIRGCRWAVLDSIRTAVHGLVHGSLTADRGGHRFEVRQFSEDIDTAEGFQPVGWELELLDMAHALVNVPGVADDQRAAILAWLLRADIARLEDAGKLYNVSHDRIYRALLKIRSAHAKAEQPSNLANGQRETGAGEGGPL